jgi:3-oxoacyl-[acyl-carrier protein] reductase
MHSSTRISAGFQTRNTERQILMAEPKKVALVTGGSRGIGKAISLRLAKDGYHVIINYRSNHEQAGRTLSDITAAGGSGELCCFDVTDKSTAASAMEELLKKHALHSLVFSAGIHQDNLLIYMTEEQWIDVLNTNLMCFYTIVKPVIRQMVLQRAGRVVVMSSTSGESGLPGQVNYSAAKAGLIGAVKALALECAKRNVLVNAITPGFIQTDMMEGMNIKELTARVPMARIGKPEEVASVVSFLASDDASYITGQVIRVNGGIYL